MKQTGFNFSDYNGPPSQPHSQTSRDAAEDIEPTVAGLRLKVLEYLRARRGFGATDEECQLFLSMNPSTQRPRRIELVNSGHVVQSDMKRKTSTGRNATVWLAKEFSEIPF